MELLLVASLWLFWSSPVFAGSLKDIEHVVIFMQENRSWNTYFGTMAGVRGFNDPNVQINPDGLPVWYQKVDPDMSNPTHTLLPWYLGHLGGDWPQAIQCMVAGDNGYQDNHAAINDGLNDHWARNNTPWSWGYLKRSDIPVQFAVAEAWTSADMYQEAQITSTNPNRVTLVSGSVNAPGGPQTPDQGGVYLDNNEIPGETIPSRERWTPANHVLNDSLGCERLNVGCYPLNWKTIFEFYEEAGVSWQVYQDMDNFDDNPLAWFEQFQRAPMNSSLAQKGMSYLGLAAFYDAAKKGTLPRVSFIVGPMELSEHPPYMPIDGAWLQKQVVDAVTGSPKYASTVLMISYDETGGFGDHVTPFHSPEGTPGDWVEDPLGLFGQIYVGPGVRVPFYMISPWTRGGRVFTERADHNSQILFLEQWLSEKGYKGIVTDQMVLWRREHMSNLVNAFNFDHPDYSLPVLPDVAQPHVNERGLWDGTALCEAQFPVSRPPVPYGKQNITEALSFEDGFKECVGYLTEGRYLVFERSGFALTNLFPNSSRKRSIRISPASKDHRNKNQRWVIHYSRGEERGIFKISSALDGSWIGPHDSLLPADDQAHAAEIKITFLGNGRGYSLQYVDLPSSHFRVLNNAHMYNALGTNNAEGAIKELQQLEGFRVWSVSYHD